MKHRILLASTLLCCAVLAGCTGQGTDGAAGDSTRTPGSSPTEAATVSGAADTGRSSPSGEPAPSTSLGSATPSSGSAVPAMRRRCHTSELRASVGANRPGAGQSNFAVVLTNGSRRTCTVRGFPAVAFVNGKGEAVTPDPERAMGQEHRTVTLTPGASAWSAMTYANPAITRVTTVTPKYLLITPPEESAWLSVRWTGGEVSNTGKASVPRVSPFRAGDGA
ncbi:lipoprotein [Streptomyces viridiviolaceus]|uniref:DUF4232 domain-containing protein n=1 Tax=Streptomyces viridiviolaceus TaxID=68282 RepID=A0ABW2DYG3_9ACTN|nr:DUF4232 domain-containing protein [Streptomyces viridiviolaceus]GHB17518.1 lipoprotein [Streptomyces viridiviolaceus]